MSSATISFIRACVPGSLTDSLDREPAAIWTCARLRWRAHSDIKPGSQQARNPASHRSAARLPILQGCGTWRRTIEHTNSLIAMVRRRTFPISGDTPSGILNFFRPQAAGKLFSLRVALVNDANQAANRIARILSFTPVQVFSLPFTHARNMQRKDTQNHGQITRKHG